MNNSTKSALGLRAPLCQFLANNSAQRSMPADERAHSQLMKIDTDADSIALTCVTRSPIQVQFSTSQTRAPLAHKFNERRDQGRAA